MWAGKLSILRNNYSDAGYKSPQDDLFTKVNENLLSKHKKLGIIHSTPEGEVKHMPALKVGPIICNVLGCNKEFNDISSYNTHYNSIHRYLCNVCRRSLPTAHLLDLHLSEQHDSYFAVLAERGKANYACFLQECHKVMKSPQERKKHCIEDHNLPPDFRYGLLDKKIKKEQYNSTANPKINKDDVIRETDSEAMDLDSESLKKTKNFSFGMPKEKMFSKGSNKALDLKELEYALPKHNE